MAKKAATKRKKTPDRDLSARERLFVAEYLTDLNGTQAAIRAGFAAASAHVKASQLLRKVKVAEAIAAGNAARLARVSASADALLQRLIDEMNADISDLFTADGSLKPISDWPMVFRTGLVAGIEVEEEYEDDVSEEREPQSHGGALKRAAKARSATGRIAKIKLADRNAIKQMFGRHVTIQAFKDKVQVSADAPLKKLLGQIAGSSIRPAGDGGAR